jgi:pilus assembly protein CpaC
MLSGLLQDKIREEARGLPFLRNIPVLGALFGSEEFLKDRSELVVILLPTTSPPESVLLSRGQQLLK